MKKLRRYKSCFEQVISENPFGIEIIVCLLSGWLLLASLILPADADGGLTLQLFGNANLDDEELAVSYMRTMHEKIMYDEAIKETDAAANGRVYLICGDINTGPMQAAGTAFMAKILHPELFEDLDPEAILKENFEKWQGIPYQGVWIYPPLE